MADVKTHGEQLDARRQGQKASVFEATGIGDLLVLEPKPYSRLTVAIVDVSQTRLQVELQESLELSSRVEIRLREVAIRGHVESCRKHGKGHYRLRIVMTDIVETPLRTRHLPEADLELYLLGNGLTEAERHFYEAHVAICMPCQQVIEEVRQLLARVDEVRARMVVMAVKVTKPLDLQA